MKSLLNKLKNASKIGAVSALGVLPLAGCGEVQNAKDSRRSSVEEQNKRLFEGNVPSSITLSLSSTDKYGYQDTRPSPTLILYNIDGDNKTVEEAALTYARIGPCSNFREGYVVGLVRPGTKTADSILSGEDMPLTRIMDSTQVARFDSLWNRYYSDISAEFANYEF